MTTKPTHDHILKLQNLESEINSVRSIFDNRLGEIIGTFERIFDRKVDWYDYTNGDAEISGFITTEMLADNEFNLDGGFNFSGYVALLDEEGEWDFSYSFPTRFFFEDFEDELVEGLQKYKQKEIQKKQSAKLKREERKKKKEELLAKMSDEDKKILGIK